MTVTRELEEGIREYINEPRRQSSLMKQGPGTWNKICSSLDVIGDTEEALLWYQAKGSFENDGEAYIAVYGVLQALYLQQDAVIHLSQALGAEQPKNPTLNRIRAIRNDTVGHPTNRGKQGTKSFHYISRPTITPEGFDVLNAFAGGPEDHFGRIDTKKMIHQQRKELEAQLTRVLDALREEAELYTQAYRNHRLSDMIPGTLEYHIEKIADAVVGPGDARLGHFHINCLSKALSRLKSELSKRQLAGVYASVDENLEQVSRAIAQLGSLLEEENPAKPQIADGQIYLASLDGNLRDLAEMLAQLDASYCARPNTLPPHNEEAERT